MITYHDIPASLIASLLETKLMVNSTKSEAKFGVRFLSVDLKGYFLKSPMVRLGHIKIPSSLFPLDISSRYDLLNTIYIKIKKSCMD